MWCKCCHQRHINHPSTHSHSDSEIEQETNLNDLKSSFRDDWNLLLELFLIWIIWFIGMFISVPVSLYGGNSNNDEYHRATVKAASSLFFQISLLIISIYCPFVILLKLKKPRKQTSKTRNLTKILSKKIYFFAFVEHLVQELSIENLTFLMELWQFKYEQKYDLTNENNKNMQKIQPSATWNGDGDSKEESFETGSLSITDHEYSTTKSSLQRFCSEKDKKMINKFLSSLPWCNLPIADSIALNAKNKWNQCCHLYSKFFNDYSYYALNIGYSAKDEINYNFQRLQLFHRCPITLIIHEDVKMDNMEQQQSQSSTTNDGDDGAIHTEEQFNDVMMELFDCAVKDIMQNLQDSLARFISTDTFKMISNTKTK